MAGYWTRKEGKGLSMVIFESEESARQASERVPEMVFEHVTLEDVDVREVVAARITPALRSPNSCAEHGLAFRHAATQTQQAEWLSGQGRPDDADPLLAEAGETFERLETTPWLERLEAAEAALLAKIPA